MSRVEALRAAQDSTGARFEALYAEHHVVLRRIAHMLCGDRETAADLLQDTWLRAWRALGSLHDTGAGRAWLVTILKREYARLFERKHLDRVDLDDNSPELARDPAPHLAILLEQLLGRLRPGDRELLLMQVVDGLPCADIAARSGTSRNAVALRLHRLKKHIKAM